MLRVLFTRRHRRHEETLDHIDTLEVELGMKPARERPHRSRTADEAAEAWTAAASVSAMRFNEAVQSGRWAMAMRDVPNQGRAPSSTPSRV